MRVECPLVSVVIPTKCEGPELWRTVGRLVPHLPAAHEILLVINGTSSRNATAAGELAAVYPTVHLLQFGRPLGKGGAILAGLAHARGEVLGFVDADGPFPAGEVVQRLVRPVLEGRVEAAIASKWLGRRFGEVKSYNRTSKKVFGRLLNLGTHALFGLPFADTQGGAKFLSREVWQRLDPHFTCRGFDFDVELLFKLQRAGARVAEVYLPARRSAHSTVEAATVLRMTGRLAALRLRYLL